MNYNLHRRFGAAVSKSREVELPQTTKELKQLRQGPSQMGLHQPPHLHPGQLQSSADPSEESLEIVTLMRTVWTQSHLDKGQETFAPTPLRVSNRPNVSSLIFSGTFHSAAVTPRKAG
ncbi:hypothetical protein BASA84_001706 [Batrachochytrium salamandrivorans]|nr:hypothetical protein BASA84_001706 [Batrachochytrium salamandrivorans]